MAISLTDRTTGLGELRPVNVYFIPINGIREWNYWEISCPGRIAVLNPLVNSGRSCFRHNRRGWRNSP